MAYVPNIPYMPYMAYFAYMSYGQNATASVVIGVHQDNSEKICNWSKIKLSCFIG